jgi:hypothetical protein
MLGISNPVSLTLSPYAIAIAPGASGMTTVTASPAIGFTGAITFACTSPVAYITCSLNPASQTINGTTAVQSTVTLNVAATMSKLEPTLPQQTSKTTAYAFLLPLGAFALLGFARKGRGLRKLSLVFALCLSFSAIVGITGCGGSSTPSKPTAPSGTQVVSITAKSAAVTQTIQVTVNIGN